MSAAVCPYCRGAIDDLANQQLCSGCGTPHHADCYAENAGCTVFGCSAAPPEEPKLSLAGGELAPAAQNRAESASGSGVTAATKVAPPPPLPGLATSPVAEAPRIPRAGVGSVLFGAAPVAAVAVAQAPVEFDFTPNPDAKNRMTFVVLGALLGALGAHNFYAGYRGKAFTQLFITVLTAGFGSPMSWVWAVIDICTVERDAKGIRFRS